MATGLLVCTLMWPRCVELSLLGALRAEKIGTLVEDKASRRMVWKMTRKVTLWPKWVWSNGAALTTRV